MFPLKPAGKNPFLPLVALVCAVTLSVCLVDAPLQSLPCPHVAICSVCLCPDLSYKDVSHSAVGSPLMFLVSLDCIFEEPISIGGHIRHIHRG